MYEGTMKRFRESIVKGASEHLKKSNLTIQGGYNDSKISVKDFQSKLEEYTKQLEQPNNEQLFGGSLKHNNVQELPSVLEKGKLNLSFCLDEKYRDNMVCSGVVEYDKLFHYMNLYRQLIGISEYYKSKRVGIEPLSNLLIKRTPIITPMTKQIEFDNLRQFKEHVKNIDFIHILNDENISFSNTLMDVLIHESKLNPSIEILDILKLDGVISMTSNEDNINPQIRIIPHENTTITLNECKKKVLETFIGNVDEHKQIEDTVGVLAKLYVIYNALLTVPNKNLSIIYESMKSRGSVVEINNKLNILTSHLKNLLGESNLTSHNEIISKKIQKIISLVANIGNVTIDNLDMKTKEFYKILLKVKKNKFSYFRNFKALKTMLMAVTETCENKDLTNSNYKDYLRNMLKKNKNFILPINLLAMRDNKYNTCQFMLLMKYDITKRVYDCTLYVLKGDIDLNVNRKVYETNVFYDYNNVMKLLANEIRSLLPTMNISINVSMSCRKRMTGLFSINQYADSVRDLTLTNSNKYELNLIKNEYFYLENYYQALYDIHNILNKSISYESHVGHLYYYGILKDGNMKNKLENLGTHAQNMDKTKKSELINLFISKVFSKGKQNYHKYVDFMKIIKLYINQFMNEKFTQNINTNDDIKHLSNAFISKILFVKHSKKEDFDELKKN